MPSLSLQDLNRATLARQLLLERSNLPVPSALERLVGLQAQLALPPYVGLWTRLQGYRRIDLAGPIESHAVVKATWLRATLHLVTTEDYLSFRRTLQPALSGAAESIARQRGATFDQEALLAEARRYIGEQPRTFAQISERLAEYMPGQDLGALRYTVRTHLPLVQVPISGGWSYPGNPAFTLAEPWIGRPLASAGQLRELVLRYLAAFGPASPVDMQTWSGLPKLKEAFEALKPELQILQDEQGHVLYDLPGGPQPGEDVPAPPRFLPEFDNLLLSHKNRRRVLADAYRSRVYLPGLRVAATFLVDGFVRGVWQIEKARKGAALVVEPFEPLSAPHRLALSEEGDSLLRFIEPEAASYEVRFI